MAERELPPWAVENLPAVILDSTLFRFRVTLPSGAADGSTVTHEVTMMPDLVIDYDRLEKQLLEAPAQYAYWSAMYSELKLAAVVQDRKIKAKRGRLAEALQDGARQNGTRLTVDQIKSLIEKDADILRMEVKLAAQQRDVGKMYGMMEAIKMKLESLRSLAGFKRQERQEF